MSTRCRGAARLLPGGRRRAAPLHRTLIVVAFAATFLAACGSGPPERPSIVFIIVDDLGAVDLPVYGHPFHRTPNIDRLAGEGLRFTRAYSAAPVCAPSRAALMTGKSPARLHLTHSLPPLPRPLAAMPAADRGPATQRLTEPRSATWLAPGEVTIAERLRERGYRTALIGKWHLGRGESGPASQGFDVAIGGEDEAAPASFFPPWGLTRLADGPSGEYLTDRLTDEALAFLDASRDAPFFLVLSHFAVHTPIEAPPEHVRDWKERLASLPGAVAEPADSLRAAYAAMLESVDRSVGRVLAKLDQLGIAKETLVILTSDNGAVVETPDTGRPVSTNAPLRAGKATLYEGGLRVPLLVRWPAVVKRASETSALTTTVDWYPTLLDITAVREDEAGGDESRRLPRDAGNGEGGNADELDGSSLLPLLEGERVAAQRALHFHYPHYIAGYRRDRAVESWWNTPGAAIVEGSSKLIERFDGDDELYDLATDPGESRNLATGRGDDVRRLRRELDGWLAAQEAHLPRLNLAYDAGGFARGLADSLARLGRAEDWTPNGGCEHRVARGRLHLDCTEPPFVIGPEMLMRGPLRVVARFTTSGTRGAPGLWYRTPDKPSFSGGRVAFSPPIAGEVWEARIERESTILQLRLDFGTGKGGRAEIDWIRVESNGEREPKTLVVWSFDQVQSKAEERALGDAGMTANSIP